MTDDVGDPMQNAAQIQGCVLNDGLCNGWDLGRVGSGLLVADVVNDETWDGAGREGVSS